MSKVSVSILLFLMCNVFFFLFFFFVCLFVCFLFFVFCFLFVCLFVCLFYCGIDGCFTVLEIVVLVECTSAHLIF